MGRAGGPASSAGAGFLSLKIDLSFLMLWVGARPDSQAKLQSIQALARDGSKLGKQKRSTKPFR